jgi:hypothetical protein
LTLPSNRVPKPSWHQPEAPRFAGSTNLAMAYR